MKTITLKNLHEATAQEVFDRVAKHLLTQSKKSLDKLGLSCQYKGEDGLKCAAGCLISDEEYDEEFEGESWSTLVDRKGVTNTHKELIGALQYVHDRDDVEEWRYHLHEVAKEFNLNTDSIK